MGRVVEVPSVCFCTANRNTVDERGSKEHASSGFTYGRELPAPILVPFGRRSFFGTERVDTPSSEVIPSSRRPRKSSPNISANPPMTNGLSSPSTSSPKRVSSSITPASFVCLLSCKWPKGGGAQLDKAHDFLVCIVQLLP